MARELVSKDDFVEIFVDTSIEVAESRDPKGLYKKARSGEIPNFTGISSTYEKPKNPDIIINTEENTVEDSIKIILDKIERNSEKYDVNKKLLRQIWKSMIECYIDYENKKFKKR